MDKLKTALLNHGEKIVAGVFVLVGFMALSMASWGPNTQSPLELQELSDRGKAQIAQNQWPEEEQKMFDDIPDVESLVRDKSNILTKAEDFEIGAFNPSIIRIREKRSNVAVLPPEDGRAVPVVFPLAMPPEEEDEEDESAAEDGKMESKDDKKSDEELSEEEQLEKLIAKRFGQRAAGTGGAGGMGAGSPYPGAEAGGIGGLAGGAESPYGAGAGGGAGLAAGGLAMQTTEGGYPGAAGGAYDGGSGSDLFGAYGTEMMSVKKNIRVSAGVAVTMVVDLQKQRNVIRSALHLPADYRLAQQYIQYVDILVERRRREGSPGVWTEWEQVSSEDLGEILKDSFGIDRDIVSPAVTRNTITMPLPRRAAGEWQPSEASHPRVENFELSAEEKSLIDKWNQRVNEKLEKEKAAMPEEVKQKGFSQFVQSATDIVQGMGSYGGAYAGGMEGAAGAGNYESATNYDDFASSLGEGSRLTDEQKELLDETRATADQRLLLVRFMDFTIERGRRYQYRVRLEMKNPNYNHPLDELVDPGLSIEPTLFSDWSEATPEVFVPLPHRVYVTGVDGRPGTSEKVSVSVYSDSAETGMPVMGDVRALMGLPLSGLKTVDVVDLTTEEVDLREITLRTNELLSAAEEIERPSSSEHPELKSLIDQTRGKVLVPDQICVVDGTGQLRIRSVGDDVQNEKMDRLETAEILKIYDAWRKKDAPANNFFGEGEGGGGYDGGGGLGMASGAAAAGGFYGGGGGGGYEGGAAGAGAGAGSSRSSRRSRGSR